MITPEEKRKSKCLCGSHSCNHKNLIAVEQSEFETMDEKLRQIHNWCKAYPLGVFPEPDLKAVRKALEVAGITMDSVSASNMRHILNGIIRIIEE